MLYPAGTLSLALGLICSRQFFRHIKNPRQWLLPGILCCKSDPDWIRTNDPQLRRLMLYPTELPDLYWGANIRQLKKCTIKNIILQIKKKHFSIFAVYNY